MRPDRHPQQEPEAPGHGTALLPRHGEAWGRMSPLDTGRAERSHSSCQRWWPRGQLHSQVPPRWGSGGAARLLRGPRRLPGGRSPLLRPVAAPSPGRGALAQEVGELGQAEQRRDQPHHKVEVNEDGFLGGAGDEAVDAVRAGPAAADEERLHPEAVEQRLPQQEPQLGRDACHHAAHVEGLEATGTLAGGLPVPRLGRLVHGEDDEESGGGREHDDVEDEEAVVGDGEGGVVAHRFAAWLLRVADELLLLILEDVAAHGGQDQDAEEEHHHQPETPHHGRVLLHRVQQRAQEAPLAHGRAAGAGSALEGGLRAHENGSQRAARPLQPTILRDNPKCIAPAPLPGGCPGSASPAHPCHECPQVSAALQDSLPQRWVQGHQLGQDQQVPHPLSLPDPPKPPPQPQPGGDQPRYLRRLRSTVCQRRWCRLSGTVRSLVQLGWDDGPAATPGVLLKRQSSPRGAWRGGMGSALPRGGLKDKRCPCPRASSCPGRRLVQQAAAPPPHMQNCPCALASPNSQDTKPQRSAPKRPPQPWHRLPGLGRTHVRGAAFDSAATAPAPRSCLGPHSAPWGWGAVLGGCSGLAPALSAL